MRWNAGHDRQRELFSDDAGPREPGKTLPQQIEGDHAYRDEPPELPPERPTGWQCPACREYGEDLEEDQARCTTPACRVTTFQTTYPPDRRADR